MRRRILYKFAAGIAFVIAMVGGVLGFAPYRGSSPIIGAMIGLAALSIGFLFRYLSERDQS